MSARVRADASGASESARDERTTRTAAGHAVLAAAVLGQDRLVGADLEAEEAGQSAPRAGRVSGESERTLTVSPSPLITPET